MKCSSLRRAPPYLAVTTGKTLRLDNHISFERTKGLIKKNITIKKPTQVEIGSTLKYPSQLTCSDDAQDLQV